MTTTTDSNGPMALAARCEPAVVVAGEPIRVVAEFHWVQEPPSGVAVRVRSSNREIVRRGRLRMISGSGQDRTSRYSFERRLEEDIVPASYDILLRLPGARRSTITTVTVLPTAAHDTFAALSAAAQNTARAQQLAADGDIAGALDSMKLAVAACESASETEAAAEAMLDAPNLHLEAGQPAKAASLFRKVHAIRGAAGDHDGAAYCRRRLASIKQPAAQVAHGD